MSGAKVIDMDKAFRNIGIAELVKVGVMIAIGALAWQRAQDKYDLLSARVDALEHTSGERAVEMEKRLDRMDTKLDDIQRELLNMSKGYHLQ